MTGSLTSLSQLSNQNLNHLSNNKNLNHLSNNKNLNHLSNNKNLNKRINEKIKKEKKEKVYELVDFPETGQNYGEYKGKTPKQAARKAFSRLARMSKLNNSNQKFIVFVIKEKGGKQKEHKYMGQRVKLANNGIKIKRGNSTVTIKYKNIVNKYKDM
jgi:hypothetical protein